MAKSYGENRETNDLDGKGHNLTLRFVIGEGPSGKRNFDIKIDKFGAGVWCVSLKDQNHAWFTGITTNGTFKAINGNQNFQTFRIAFFDLNTHFTLKIP